MGPRWPRQEMGGEEGALGWTAPCRGPCPRIGDRQWATGARHRARTHGPGWWRSTGGRHRCPRPGSSHRDPGRRSCPCRNCRSHTVILCTRRFRCRLRDGSCSSVCGWPGHSSHFGHTTRGPCGGRKQAVHVPLPESCRQAPPPVAPPASGLAETLGWVGPNPLPLGD